MTPRSPHFYSNAINLPAKKVASRNEDAAKFWT
jgi:hypothetical protein